MPGKGGRGGRSPRRGTGRAPGAADPCPAQRYGYCHPERRGAQGKRLLLRRGVEKRPARRAPHVGRRPTLIKAGEARGGAAAVFVFEGGCAARCERDWNPAGPRPKGSGNAQRD